MAGIIHRIYQLTDKGPLRALSLILALLVAGCVMWDPTRFSVVPPPYILWWGLALIWSVCTGVIHGSGLRLQKTCWQGIFSPLLAWLILFPAIICYFCATR
ncbi:cyd operon protein YbgE [Tatumella terrea]|uniref:cyd operon protein YbgE n=1 Tax=Tatumella terrea TaxID=419007 RepID=UPI0031D528D0